MHHITSYSRVSRCFGMNFVMRMIFSSRSCYLLEPGKVGIGIFVGSTAHLKRGTQVVAHGRSTGLAEDPAAIVSGEMDTAYAGWFAVRHTGDGGRNR